MEMQDPRRYSSHGPLLVLAIYDCRVPKLRSVENSQCGLLNATVMVRQAEHYLLPGRRSVFWLSGGISKLLYRGGPNYKKEIGVVKWKAANPIGKDIVSFSFSSRLRCAAVMQEAPNVVGMQGSCLSMNLESVDSRCQSARSRDSPLV